jgi:hypothetical protein
LPRDPFTYGQWKYAKINVDYHIEIEHHYYSVPHGLVHEEVEAWVTATTVEIYHEGQRVASHPRSYQRARHTTTPAHMPKAHQKHLECRSSPCPAESGGSGVIETPWEAEWMREGQSAECGRVTVPGVSMAA